MLTRTGPLCAPPQLRARVGMGAGAGLMGGAAQTMPAGGAAAAMGGAGLQQTCVGTGPTVCASTTQVRPPPALRAHAACRRSPHHKNASPLTTRL
jgi:hypothetical protein